MSELAFSKTLKKTSIKWNIRKNECHFENLMWVKKKHETVIKSKYNSFIIISCWFDSYLGRVFRMTFFRMYVSFYSFLKAVLFLEICLWLWVHGRTPYGTMFSPFSASISREIVVWLFLINFNDNAKCFCFAKTCPIRQLIFIYRKEFIIYGRPSGQYPSKLRSK